MAILAVFDIATMTLEQYNKVISDLEDAGMGDPEGRIYHVSSSKDGGSFIADVWESEELLNKFSDTLIPILEGAGVTPAIPQIYPVQNTISG